MPFYPVLGEGSPAENRLQKKVGTLILTSLLEDLGVARGKKPTRRFEARPGGLLTADVCVLDDVSRAPQEALGALFRALTHQEPGAGAERGVVGGWSGWVCVCVCGVLGLAFAATS